MDLVKIGFIVTANGLKEANTEVDKLLTKVDTIGTKSKKASSEFENSQKKIKDSVGKTTKETDNAIDANEKLINSYKKVISLEQVKSKYVSQGMGKTDAARLARMELSGADVTTLNNYKKAVEETNKALAAMRPVAVQAEDGIRDFAE